MAQMYRVVHTHHHQTDPEQFLQDESFRRTLPWLIYILDCFLTSSPGRHPALSSHDVNDVSPSVPRYELPLRQPRCCRDPERLSSGLGRPRPPDGEVGEFGHIVLATKAWRNVVEMMTTTTLETFSDQAVPHARAGHRCDQTVASDALCRQARPDQPSHHHGQRLHVCAHPLAPELRYHLRQPSAAYRAEDGNGRELQRRCLAHGSHGNTETVDRIFSASRSIIHSLLALEHGADKDSILCFPIFMLFSAFTAGSTVAYLALKGLAPANATETAASIVRDSLRFCQDGSESWPSVIPWQRHLSVMAKVLRDVNNIVRDRDQDAREDSKPSHQSPSIKEDINSPPPDTNPDVMDYDNAQAGVPPAPVPSQTEPRQRAACAQAPRHYYHQRRIRRSVYPRHRQPAAGPVPLVRLSGSTPLMAR